MNKTSDLQKALSGGPCEVRFDALTRQLYATDASIYQIEPLAVAFPRNAEEAAAIVRAAAEADTPIIPRGAGTGLAGGAIGEGLVVDMARYDRQIVGYDPERRTVRVGPGVVLDQLNAYLRPHGMFFGPDVATSSRATLGGMIANNSSGARAPIYRTTADHIAALEVILPDGAIAWVGKDQPGLADLQAELYAHTTAVERQVRERFPNVLSKRWPGYGLDRFLDTQGDLTRLFSGSEGTLGLIARADLNVVPLPREKGIAVYFFASVAEAMQASVEFLDLRPAAVEHIDRVLFDQTRGQSVFAETRALLRLDDEPCESILIVEFYDDVADRLAAIAERRLGLRSMQVTDPHQMTKIWDLRKAGLSLLTGRKGPAKPIAGIEDVAVRPEELPAYVDGLQAIMGKLDLQASYYGHAAAGLLHVRPIIDLHRAEEIAKYRRLADEVSALVTQFSASISAEHGVGMARTEFLAEHVGPEIHALMRDIKQRFDPSGLFNPGKVIADGVQFRIDQSLRQGDGYCLEPPFVPVLAFAAKDGSFVANLEQCNGCGGCRKDEPTMCPTYQATGDEIMSTRGRANTIRAAFEGRLSGEDDPLLSPDLAKAVTNCLACKACTVECPSNVNMTSLKAEVLHARQKQSGLTLREYMVSSIDIMGKLAMLWPGMTNAMLQLKPVRKIMDRWIGFTEHRPFPAFARYRFDRWFARHAPQGPAASRGPVYLWDDTSVRYYEPNVGEAAVAVLEAAGYEVRLVKSRKCCGRPAFSVGRLDMAKRLGQYNVDLLRDMDPDVPILFLEPSCYSMFVEDYRDLGVQGWDRVATRCALFDRFILDLLTAQPEAIRFRPGYSWVAVHGHCHAKALGHGDASARLAKLLPNAEVETLETGCCGMAGQFGQLREKYELSVQVAQPLVEQVNALRAGTEVVACGTSCRNQIDHLTPVHPLHVAELLAQNLDTGAA